MTTIFLMRHARAQKAARGMKDIDRPLTESGRADAHEMGKLLLTRFGLPERVLCSTAVRTRETLQNLDLDFPATAVSFSDALFDGAGTQYVAAIAEETAETILLIGHNPFVHDAAEHLAGGGDGIARGALAAGFPTAAIAVLDFDGPATGLRKEGCTLRAFLTPTSAATA